MRNTRPRRWRLAVWPRLERRAEPWRKPGRRERLLLPAQGQVPGLLDGIIQAAQANGLSVQGIELASQHPSGFYAELPMSVTLVGRYHQIGAFLSGVAELPHIVTWHDFDLRPAQMAEGLRLRICRQNIRLSGRRRMNRIFPTLAAVALCLGLNACRRDAPTA